MGKISNSTLNKVLLRTQGCQFAHNYERMQSLSLTYCFAPVLEELYKDAPKEERVNAMKRHLEYFNTHPLAIPFILGITAALEETTDEDQKDTVVGIKTSLMGPLSGIGDSFFQGTIRVIAFGLGVQLAQQGSIMGPILAMLISIVPSVLITWFAAKMGYQGGHEYLSKLQGGDLMEKLMYVCGIVGLMSVGGMIATLIGATTPLQFAEGTVVIQDILDGMMPQMISLGLTGLMYWLIKKNVNTGWLLVIAIVGGIALSAAGILA